MGVLRISTSDRDDRLRNSAWYFWSFVGGPRDLGGGFDFWPHSVIPVTWKPKYIWQGVLKLIASIAIKSVSYPVYPIGCISLLIRLRLSFQLRVESNFTADMYEARARAFFSANHKHNRNFLGLVRKKYNFLALIIMACCTNFLRIVIGSFLQVCLFCDWRLLQTALCFSSMHAMLFFFVYTV